jgi:hypothetical protein
MGTIITYLIELYAFRPSISATVLWAQVTEFMDYSLGT